MSHRLFTLFRYFPAVILYFFAWTAQSQTFVEAGGPALDRVWSGADYQRAAEVLSSGKIPLPTLADAEGRAFFKRFTSTENLNFAFDTNLPIAVRLDDFSGSLTTGVKTILMQYLTAANKGVNVHTETALILSFMLRLGAAGIVLVEEFVPTIPKDDKYDVRLGGLKRMNSGLTTVFLGAETSLGETSFYSHEDLSQILQTMVEVLPTFLKVFPGGYRVELRKKLEERGKAFPGEKDAANLQKMLGELGP